MLSVNNGNCKNEHDCCCDFFSVHFVYDCIVPKPTKTFLTQTKRAVILDGSFAPIKQYFLPFLVQHLRYQQQSHNYSLSLHPNHRFNISIFAPSMKKIVFLFLSVVVLASCSKYQKLLKSTDADAKYNAAVKYYEKKDYYRALPLFEELIALYRGQKRGESIYYYYAYCNYYLEDYEF